MTEVRNGKCRNYNGKIPWEKTEEIKSVIVVHLLGGFHIFHTQIGKYLESSGISDIWAESEVFGETTAQNILKGIDPLHKWRLDLNNNT